LTARKADLLHYQEALQAAGIACEVSADPLELVVDFCLAQQALNLVEDFMGFRGRAAQASMTSSSAADFASITNATWTKILQHFKGVRLEGDQNSPPLGLSEKMGIQRLLSSYDDTAESRVMRVQRLGWVGMDPGRLFL
jgi:hypothetical protein